MNYTALCCVMLAGGFSGLLYGLLFVYLQTKVFSLIGADARPAKLLPFLRFVLLCSLFYVFGSLISTHFFLFSGSFFLLFFLVVWIASAQYQL